VGNLCSVDRVEFVVCSGRFGRSKVADFLFSSS
jgi:hypothetical protein